MNLNKIILNVSWPSLSGYVWADRSFDEGDLVGLKVSHDFDEMDEGEARILTLKDSRILDNEGSIY